MYIAVFFRTYGRVGMKYIHYSSTRTFLVGKLLTQSDKLNLRLLMKNLIF